MRSRGVFAAPARAGRRSSRPPGREGDALTDALEAAGDRRDLVSVVTGGATRQASVAAGLDALWADVEIVLVHDAARALTPPAVFERVVAAIDAGRRGRDPGAAGHRHDQAGRRRARSSAAVDRAELAGGADAAGLPPRRPGCRLPAADRDFTDDAALVAAAGHAVAVGRGRSRSRSRSRPPPTSSVRGRSSRGIRSPPSTAHLEHAVAGPARRGRHRRARASAATGTLWLAGLEWPGEPALSGHSDGDAVAHAIVDALLSAAGLGDIGTHFGTDHPEYAGAHADAFLARTLGLLGEAGWRVGNVAVQVQANRPRFAARRAEAEAALSAALGGASVSVSATTTDGLGFTGRGRGRRRLRDGARRARLSRAQSVRVMKTENGSSA